MAGSKKGEHRGNARKRSWKTRTHETPNEIMHDAARQQKPAGPVIERRIQISRMILGLSGDVRDMTPKEVLLEGMHYNMQAVRDLVDALDAAAQLPPSPENNLLVERLEREVERIYNVAGEFAYKAAGFIHPKLLATHEVSRSSQNQSSILQEFMDEVDELERKAPIPIEYKPSRTGS